MKVTPGTFEGWVKRVNAVDSLTTRCVQVQSHCDHIVANGGLQLLQRIYQLRRDSLKIQRNIVRIIGNLALNEGVHQAVAQSGGSNSLHCPTHILSTFISDQLPVTAKLLLSPTVLRLGFGPGGDDAVASRHAGVSCGPSSGQPGPRGRGWEVPGWHLHPPPADTWQVGKQLRPLQCDAFGSCGCLNFHLQQMSVFDLWTPSQPIKADVLFIHGILGAAFKTWRQQDRGATDEPTEGGSSEDYTECWPKVLID